MNRIWLQSYPAGVPADIDPGRYGSLVELLEESFLRFGDRAAYTCMGISISFSEIDRLSRALAAYLQGRGVHQGARVAIMMPNVLQYPVALAALLRAGFVVVNVNPLYTPRELQHQLKDSGAEAIIILENFAATLEKALHGTSIKHVVIASLGDLLGFAKGRMVNFVVRRVKKMVPAYRLPDAVSFSAALRLGMRRHFSRPAVKADDIAALQYTGGTTGVSKGAVLLHKTIVAGLLAAEAWVRPALERRPPKGQLTIACALPLYHVFALIVCGLFGMRTGARNILIPNPRDMGATIDALKRHRIHLFPAVNTLFNGLLNSPRVRELDFSELAMSIGGGMAVQAAVAQRWQELTGVAICEGYGLSETTASVVCNPSDSDKYTGTIGVPMPSVEVKIIDDEGREVPLGQPGEIAIRSPQVMAGYWKRPDETAKVMTPDGFFKSGDVGFMNAEGHIKLVDRKKDMILVSGFNVYPNEIEDVVANLPGVQECAAVGVPDASSGEAVMLFIVPRDETLTTSAVASFCRQQLTGYKQPKYIEFRTELPKTNVGKILRRELRDQATSEGRPGGGS